jgi:ADP-heptose:LPS heptosyltransferase
LLLFIFVIFYFIITFFIFLSFQSIIERLYLLASWALACLQRPERVGQYQRILIIKLDDIGDMVYATPMFAELRRHFVGSAITLFCKKNVAVLVKNDPNLDVIESDFSCLKSVNYDLIIDARGGWRVLLHYVLKHRGAWLSKGAVRWKNRKKRVHDAATNLEIIAPLVGEVVHDLEPKLYWDSAWLLPRQLNVDKPFAVFHLGGNSALRHWRLDRYAALANHLHLHHKLDICVVGVAAESHLTAALQALCDFAIIDLTGGLALDETAALLSKARIFVGNESGPLHVACAVQCPSVGLFGPGVPDVFYPHNATILHSVLPCNPCQQKICSQPQDWCMDRIAVIDVLAAADAILQKPLQS